MRFARGLRLRRRGADPAPPHSDYLWNPRRPAQLPGPARVRRRGRRGAPASGQTAAGRAGRRHRMSDWSRWSRSPRPGIRRTATAARRGGGGRRVRGGRGGADRGVGRRAQRPTGRCRRPGRGRSGCRHGVAGPDDRRQPRPTGRPCRRPPRPPRSRSSTYRPCGTSRGRCAVSLESIFEEGLRDPDASRGRWHWTRPDDRYFARPLAHSRTALQDGLDVLAAITPPDAFAADHAVLQAHYAAAIDLSQTDARTGEGRGPARLPAGRSGVAALGANQRRPAERGRLHGLRGPAAVLLAAGDRPGRRVRGVGQRWRSASSRRRGCRGTDRRGCRT